MFFKKKKEKCKCIRCKEIGLNFEPQITIKYNNVDIHLCEQHTEDFIASLKRDPYKIQDLEMISPIKK